MTARKPPPKPKPDCAICAGKGWYYAGDVRSPWPHECFRCFPPHAQVKGVPTKEKRP